MTRCKKIVLSILALPVSAIAITVGYFYSLHGDVIGLDGPVPATTAIADPALGKEIAEAQTELANAQQELAAPSLSIAVTQSGKIVWSETRGYSDVASKRPADIETVYPIGSVSKPITAMAALRLAERGAIDLDANVHEQVAYFPAKHGTLTLRQLLSHQAGIRHYGFALIPPVFSEAALDREFASTEEAVALFADDPLLFKPDTGFSYSTFGYTLASAVLEEATGQPFLTILQREVFDPAGMANSGPDRPAVLGERRATGYIGFLSATRAMTAPQSNSSYKWAGGGLASTPTDLARFGAAILNGDLLGPDLTDVMFTPRHLANGSINEQQYGLGWRVGSLEITDADGHARTTPLISHGGTADGATAIILLVPEYNLVIAACANSLRSGGSGPITTAAARIARKFIAAKPVVQPQLQRSVERSAQPNSFRNT